MYTLKKSLGQHFLKDENICRRIVDEVKKCSPENLLEVGPGGGALTKYLLRLPLNFKAVELDEEKVSFLIKTYPQLQDKIIHQSVLEMEKPFVDSFTVVGNFPYNISTEILFKMLEWREHITCLIGMFQKEVAQRVAAKEGSKVYGVTSVLIQAFFEVIYLFDVDENSFIPPPKVKSGVIKLLPLQHAVYVKSKQAFFTLVKTAFGQRRKTLRNACRSIFDAGVLQQPIFDKRAEQLKVSEFAALTFLMK